LGLAPLRSLINQVLDERALFGRVIILYGARTPAELLFKDELQQWAERSDVELLLSVDRGDETWTGNVGVITTLFRHISVRAAVKTVGAGVYRSAMEFSAKVSPKAHLYARENQGALPINNISCQSAIFTGRSRRYELRKLQNSLLTIL
jgi:ferredoxin-NADP reductase